MLKLTNLVGFGKRRPTGGGGVTFMGASAGQAGSGTSMNVTPPAHAAGDILLLHGQNGSDGLLTAPGYASIGSPNQARVIDHGWLWKRATTNNEGNAVLTPASSSGALKGIIYCFRGCVATGTPFEDPTLLTYDDTGDLDTVVSPAIDTLGANRLAVAFAGNFNAPAYASGYPPALWTAGGYDTASGYGFTMIHRLIAAAGNVPQVTIGNLAAGSYYWQTMTLAFIPA